SEPMELTFCPATSEASIATDFCVLSTATPPQALRQLAEKLKKARVHGGDRLQLYWDHKSLKSYLPISQFLEDPQELMGIPGEPSIPATAQIVRAVFERRWQITAEGDGRSAQFLDQISRALDEFCADVIQRIAPPK
ncbi:MAG: hypothetical protein P1V35_02030, partial [Planctomycetota bacterium]|nr:hypothetical protein [Planctomycetota bacterium]